MRRHSAQWLIFFGAWLLPGFYFAIQVYLQRAYEDRPLSPGQALLRGVLFWLLWVVSTPIILWLARTFPILRSDWMDGALFHLSAGFVFSFMHLLAYVFVSSWLSNGTPPASISSLLAEFQPVFPSNFAWWSLIYWTILVACYAFDYYRQSREGQVRASQLEAQLAQAQLQALKMQLHPHFLFNTLHSISALMRDDVEAADQMIARLGEFLRMTLQHFGEDASEHETTLQQELKFLRCYLEIEQFRFQDRLTTIIEIDPAVAHARVPNLLLQPIVENAVRHGIAPQKKAGLITVRAQRNDGRLLVEVQDNGRGLPPDRIGRDGVGLANTRARLKQLYGEDFRFDLTNLAEGGLLVTIEIPLGNFN